MIILTEKPKKFAETSLNVKILGCDKLHLCALNDETYFNRGVLLLATLGYLRTHTKD